MLVDVEKLNSEAKKVIFKNNTSFLNSILVVFFIFFVVIICIIGYNDKKNSSKTNTIKKLKYIIHKTNNIISN